MREDALHLLRQGRLTPSGVAMKWGQTVRQEQRASSLMENPWSKRYSYVCFLASGAAFGQVTRTSHNCALCAVASKCFVLTRSFACSVSVEVRLHCTYFARTHHMCKGGESCHTNTTFENWNSTCKVRTAKTHTATARLHHFIFMVPKHRRPNY